MTDSLLANDGFFFLLNDGTSHILLNEHAGGGVTLQGFQSTQVLKKKKRTKLVDVEFSFWLISELIKRVELLQFGSKLHPYGIYTDALRESFILPLSGFRQKFKQLKKERLEEIRESILDEDFTLNFAWLKWLNKRLRHGG